MAEGISVTGQKKIETLCKEFNEKFPYLCLCVFPMNEWNTIASAGELHTIDYSLTIAQIRSQGATGSITITGNKLVKTLEQEFRDVVGLNAQVGYTESNGSTRYTGQANDSLTLTALNKKCQETGCKKNTWKPQLVSHGNV